MADEGLIDGAPGRAFHKMGGLPKVTVLRVVDVDDGGNVWAVPDRWEADGVPAPRLRVREKKGGALGVGARILARTEEAGQRLDRASDEGAAQGRGQVSWACCARRAASCSSPGSTRRTGATGWCPTPAARRRANW